MGADVGDDAAGTDRPDLDVVAARRFPALPESAGEARRFIQQFCQAADLPDDLCHTAALLVTELVTNAIVHGRTTATVEVHRPADTLRIAVRDDNPELPAVGDHPELSSESGRGLLIVSVLAPRWGIERTDGSKQVWFELTVGD